MGWSEAEILEDSITVGSTRKEVIRMTKTNLNNRIDKEINEQGIPSSQKMEKYNKKTIEAIKEGRKIAKDPTAIGFWSIEKLKKEL